MPSAKVTVTQLRWILAHADGDATLAEAVEQFDAAKRREANDVAHAERMVDYEKYLANRREREREQVQRAADDAKQAAIAAGPISRDSAYMVYKEAADLERPRFEIREPKLEFQEWLDAGSPEVHQLRSADLQAKLTGAVNEP